jgi:hypothetical protein
MCEGEIQGVKGSRGQGEKKQMQDARIQDAGADRRLLLFILHPGSCILNQLSTVYTIP